MLLFGIQKYLYQWLGSHTGLLLFIIIIINNNNIINIIIVPVNVNCFRCFIFYLGS